MQAGPYRLPFGLLARPFRSRKQLSPRNPPFAVLASTSISYISIFERATEKLAAALADQRRAGDCICLRGEVGAGKSAFSRAYIRHVEEDDSMPVPSPTYLLQNIYEYTEGPPIYHYDLYRLGGQADLQRLDLRTSLETAVNLIEWPERLESMTPLSRLDLKLEVLPPDLQIRAAEKGVLTQPMQADLYQEIDAIEEDDGEEDAEFADHRWRLISLQAHGKQWESLVAELADQSLSRFGLHLLTEDLSQKLDLEGTDKPEAAT